MTDAPESQRDWRDTVFLPKTDFPMKAGLAAKEPAILARWAEIGVYERLRELRAGRERFILHDGPPYANGDIHMGHAMNKVLKDIIVRSQSLLGKDAPYVPGWDCHGLPIEWKVEEQYRAKKLDKDQVPVAQFRAECRAYAEKWVAVQRAQFERLGVMGDWNDPYLTMKFDAEAAIVGELLKFAESGQLYRGAKPVMWSPVEKTALAEAEVEYEDVVSTQIDVAFEIVEAPNCPALRKAAEWCGNVSAVIWTTTPWTIPVNQALSYGPAIKYSIVNVIWQPSTIGGCYLVASELLETFIARLSETPVAMDASDTALKFSVVATVSGAELAGATARHPIANLLSPLPFRGGAGGGGSPSSAVLADSPHPDPSPEGEGLKPASQLAEFFLRPRPFLPGDFVTTDAGTGLVHMAPDHGEDDFALCREYGIDPVFAVDGAGMYRADWAWLGGQGSVINKRFVSAEGPICSDLRAVGALLAASDDFAHSYPHSWRSKAKVIFRATPQWFIPMDRESLSPWEREGDAEGGGRVRADFAAPELPSPRAAASPAPLPQGAGNGATLREIALDAIARTHWVPARAENRITAMVSQRPDWVISRQRAWGVPIALYVNRANGEYLNDPAVNARIVEAFRQGGADAWFAADHQALLGPDYRLADYEVITDILDVWFDSGSTHAFVIEARYGEGTRANLYLEGSDQHRGWFQSSLLESAGTRGRAPYDAVLTHGFALDERGRKMSKSLGNVVDPLKIIAESGADILRMWVAQTDYFEDVRIGKEVLGTTSDAYRKLRNTFRYLLGALDGFDESERVVVADMPELERYILHRLAMIDTELREAATGYEFNRYLRLLTDFAAEDLSAFFFDIRKDCLYCDAPDDLKRRSYRTVLDVLFHALVRYAAPILCFTAEEVWQVRFPSEDGSVHFLEWPDFAALFGHPRAGGDPYIETAENMGSRLRGNDGLVKTFDRLRRVRVIATEAIEPLRREKAIGSSLAANVHLSLQAEDAAMFDPALFSELAIIARCTIDDRYDPVGDVPHPVAAATASPTTDHKCGRCWRHLPEVTADGALCDRCAAVVA